MLKAASVLFGGNLAGKLLGLVRELQLAAFFGTSAPVAAFRVAQTATLIPVNFFTADALNAGFVPLYVRYLREDPRRAHALFWSVCALLVALSLGVTAFLLASASWWVGVLAPGFDAATSATAAEMLRLMGLGTVPYVGCALISYLEMAHGRFALSSVRPSVQSLGLIAGTVGAYVARDPALLAWGFTGAYSVLLVVSVVRVARAGLVAAPRGWEWSGARVVVVEFWRAMRPLLLLPFLAQGTFAVERAVASFMGVETVAALDYAKFLAETGVVLIAVPLGLAGLSALSGRPREEVRERLERIVPVILIATVPVSAFVTLHSRVLVEALYENGAFDATSVDLTETILLGLGLGFWAQVVGQVLVKALNAQLRNREVIVYMAGALLANIVLNVALWRHLGPITLGIGFSAFGLVLMLLTARAMQLGAAIRACLVPLGAGVVAYALLALALQRLVTLRGIPGALAAAALFAAFWLAVVAFVPSIREPLEPLRKRVFGRAA